MGGISLVLVLDFFWLQALLVLGGKLIIVSDLTILLLVHQITFGLKLVLELSKLFDL